MQVIRRFVRSWGAGMLPIALLCALVIAPAPAQPGVAPPEAPPPRPAGTSVPVENPQLAVLGKEAYLTPPKEIADAVLAAANEIVTLRNISPDGRKFLLAKRDPMPPLERLGCACVHLAEMAFDPVACRARSLWVSSAEGFELFFPAENRTVKVKVPPKARVGNPLWSPDGSRIAFFAFYSDSTHICVADTETGTCKQITKTPVLATLVTSFQWSKDGKRILTVQLPEEGKRPVPQRPIATEPKVRITRDGKDPSRTYRYLLESPYHAQLLEHLITGQVALVNVSDGTVTNIGAPGMIRSVSAAPGESQFRVSTIKKPFSYFVPFIRFSQMESIWNLEGKSLFTLSDRNLRETEPQPVVTNPPTPKGPKGKGTNPDPMTQPPQPVNPKAPPVAPPPTDPDAKRDLSWRPDGKGMSFLQLEPTKKDDPKLGSGPKVQPELPPTRKDRVMQWLPPFGKDDAKVVYESPGRITGVQYSEDCQWIFLSQTVDGQRQITGIDLNDPKTTYVISRGSPFGGNEPKKKETPKKGDDDIDTDDQDQEQDEQPGGFPGGQTFGVGLMTRSVGGVNVVRISSTGDVYMSGTQRGRKGEATLFAKPYIDSINIKTGKKTRIFEGKGDMLETIDAVDGIDIKRVFTTRQNTKVVPDSYMTELATRKVTKLTKNVDASPWFHDLKIERIRVTRSDGFKFWVKVTLPPKAPGKLPALFWIYPREYADQASYDRSPGARGGAGIPTGGTGRFNSPAPRNMAILTLAGYAVVEPDVPIVGPTGRFNDNYIPDLRNSLWAAINELDKRGIIDRDRLACGGHSYGAFSTANALAHTPFFKAGIAGDGCYNRTLTSMSFQSERRMLWEARETYLEMSPLLWANRVNGALLMYHGMEDANVGTHPINSEALFMALDGLGKDAALYMYPYEGHGPIARETTLDLWARWVAWLDLHIKTAKKK